MALVGSVFEPRLGARYLALLRETAMRRRGKGGQGSGATSTATYGSSPRTRGRTARRRRFGTSSLPPRRP